MAKRRRKSSTTRRGGERGARASDPGHDRHGPEPSARPLDDFANEFLDFSTLLDPAHPLRRLNTLILAQGLEWQSAALAMYRRALQEGALDGPIEDHLRQFARSMMGVYLDFVKSIPKRREQLITQHSDLAKALSDAVEDLRRRLSEPGDRPDPSATRPPASRR